MDFSFLGEYAIYVTKGLEILGGLVVIASVITPLTKTPKDDEALAWVKDNILHRFAVTTPKDK